MNIAPIVLFCYKRTDTLIRCVASLQKCIESKETDLIIISDGAATDVDVEKVISVRQYLPTISGFKSIEIIERVTNIGIDYGIIDGIRQMSERFSKFIIVEDDLDVLPSFLFFLNNALNFYEDNSEVLTISAFSFVDNIPKDYKYDVYFAKLNCPWGWATWSNKIKFVDWEISDKQAFLNSKKIQKDFNTWGSDRSKMLCDVLAGKIRTWDIRLDYYLYKKGLNTLYPTRTLVQNIGFGSNDASHTFGYNRYKTNLNLTEMQILNFPKTIFFDPIISRNFIWKNSVPMRVVTKIMKFLGIKN